MHHLQAPIVQRRTAERDHLVVEIDKIYAKLTMRPLTPEERTEIETLEQIVASLDEHIERMRKIDE